MMEPYTVALTSCGRFDLLERTLRSLLPRLDGPLARVLIAEDSGDRRVHDVVKPFQGRYGKIEVIVNDPPLGQMKSVDRLYSTIDTDWVFHCEDDWEFFSGGFIESSFILLKEFDQFSMVSIRDLADFKEGYFLPGPLSHAGVPYFLIDPKVMTFWTGLTFNPGLRRMSDYRIVGPYGDLHTTARERHVSKCYWALGYSFVYLADSAVRHIGDGRQLRNHVKPTGFTRKLAASTQKRLDWMRWKLAPQSDPVYRAKQRQREADDGNGGSRSGA